LVIKPGSEEELLAGFSSTAIEGGSQLPPPKVVA
jgi:hypothetical protein